MSELRDYFPARGGFLAKAPAILGLMALAFAAGDFFGQWKATSGVQTSLQNLDTRTARLEERHVAHSRKDGHSKVIERITALERDVDHLKNPWKLQMPGRLDYEQPGIDE